MVPTTPSSPVVQTASANRSASQFPIGLWSAASLTGLARGGPNTARRYSLLALVAVCLLYLYTFTDVFFLRPHGGGGGTTGGDASGSEDSAHDDEDSLLFLDGKKGAKVSPAEARRAANDALFMYWNRRLRGDEAAAVAGLGHATVGSGAAVSDVDDHNNNTVASEKVSDGDPSSNAGGISRHLQQHEPRLHRHSILSCANPADHAKVPHALIDHHPYYAARLQCYCLDPPPNRRTAAAYGAATATGKASDDEGALEPLLFPPPPATNAGGRTCLLRARNAIVYKPTKITHNSNEGEEGSSDLPWPRAVPASIRAKPAWYDLRLFKSYPSYNEVIIGAPSEGNKHSFIFRIDAITDERRFYEVAAGGRKGGGDAAAVADPFFFEQPLYLRSVWGGGTRVDATSRPPRVTAGNPLASLRIAGDYRGGPTLLLPTAAYHSGERRRGKSGAKASGGSGEEGISSASLQLAASFSTSSDIASSSLAALRSAVGPHGTLAIAATRAAIDAFYETEAAADLKSRSKRSEEISRNKRREEEERSRGGPPDGADAGDEELLAGGDRSALSTALKRPLNRTAHASAHLLVAKAHGRPPSTLQTQSAAADCDSFDYASYGVWPLPTGYSQTGNDGAGTGRTYMLPEILVLDSSHDRSSTHSAGVGIAGPLGWWGQRLGFCNTFLAAGTATATEDLWVGIAGGSIGATALPSDDAERQSLRRRAASTPRRWDAFAEYRYRRQSSSTEGDRRKRGPSAHTPSGSTSSGSSASSSQVNGTCPASSTPFALVGLNALSRLCPLTAGQQIALRRGAALLQSAAAMLQLQRQRRDGGDSSLAGAGQMAAEEVALKIPSLPRLAAASDEGSPSPSGPIRPLVINSTALPAGIEFYLLDALLAPVGGRSSSSSNAAAGGSDATGGRRLSMAERRALAKRSRQGDGNNGAVVTSAMPKGRADACRQAVRSATGSGDSSYFPPLPEAALPSPASRAAREKDLFPWPRRPTSPSGSEDIFEGLSRLAGHKAMCGEGTEDADQSGGGRGGVTVVYESALRFSADGSGASKGKLLDALLNAAAGLMGGGGGNSHTVRPLYTAADIPRAAPSHALTFLSLLPLSTGAASAVPTATATGASPLPASGGRDSQHRLDGFPNVIIAGAGNASGGFGVSVAATWAFTAPPARREADQLTIIVVVTSADVVDSSSGLFVNAPLANPNVRVIAFVYQQGRLPSFAALRAAYDRPWRAETILVGCECGETRVALYADVEPLC